MTRARDISRYGLGVGIQSSGSVIAGVGITQLNFIGAGNTFRVSGKTVDVSISGGSGSSQWTTNTTGIITTSNVGIGTTNARYQLEVGSVGASGTTLFVSGDARITGILSIGTGTITLDPSSNKITVGTGITLDATQGSITVSGSKVADATGNANYSGIVTAGTFSGSLEGNASTATALQNARTISLSGDIVGSVSFDGTTNVSIAATIQPNSVGLGTDTTGEYVQSLSGTSNQITVTGGTGEGSTPTLSIPNQLTAPQDATVTRDLQVNRNLNVDGNITIGGTSATLFTTELKVYDPDLVLGFRTDTNGNDNSTDNTANHGGIAIASTEGSPLVNLFIAGIETTPATYKKIMWFKSGTFSGLGTDAWLSNYAIGIGSTQVPNNARLAVGRVIVGDDDITKVRNINASGIATFSNGPVLIGAATSTGTASQPLQVTGGAYVSDSVGIGTTNPTSKLHVIGDARFSGIVTATSFSGNGSQLTGVGVDITSSLFI